MMSFTSGYIVFMNEVYFSAPYASTRQFPSFACCMSHPPTSTHPLLERLTSNGAQSRIYWLKLALSSRAITMGISLIDGELMVGWPNIDQPIAELNAHWRGPISPSPGPGSR